MTINIPNVSKTTVNGYLTAGMTVCAALLSQPQLLPQRYTVVIGGVLAVLRIVTGHAQADAGQQLAQVPGQPSPQLVASHEVPNNPAEVPITDTANFPKH